MNLLEDAEAIAAQAWTAHTENARRQASADAYDARERALFRKTVDDLQAAPLADRKEAAAEWLAALRNPAIIEERTGWLLAGHYGRGAYLEARAAADGSERLNKIAILSQMLAACEWECAPRDARLAYVRELTAAERQAADNAISAALAHYSASREEDR